MNKVFQDKFDKDGNCFSACLASILEIPLSEVPNYQEENGKWYFNYKRWLQQFDCDFLSLQNWGKETIGFAPKVYAIVSGTSPRGLTHSVIYFEHKMVHDPHPEGGGVKDITDWIYIVPIRLSIGKKEVMGRAGLIKIISPYFNDIVIDLNIDHKGDYFREKIGQIADALLGKIPASIPAKECRRCEGKGKISQTPSHKESDIPPLIIICPKCNGTGKIPKDK